MGIFGKRKIKSVLTEEERMTRTFNCSGMRDGRAVVQKVHDGIRDLQYINSSKKLGVSIKFDDDVIDPEMLMMNILVNVRDAGPGFWSEGKPLEFSVEPH